MKTVVSHPIVRKVAKDVVIPLAIGAIHKKMYTLRIKLRGINEQTDVVNVESYHVDSHLKEMYYGEKAHDVEDVNMKIDNINVNHVSESLKVNYARYIACDKSYNAMTNKKTGQFSTKTDIVLKKEVLCHILLNFVSLSYGNESELSHEVYKIPIEFLMGKDSLNENFKFFIKYDDQSKLTNQDSVDIIFRTNLD